MSTNQSTASTTSTRSAAALAAASSDEPANHTRSPFTRVFLIGFFVIWGVVYASGAPTSTGIELGVVAAIATALVATLVERKAFGVPTRQALSTLGLGRPTGKGLAVGAGVAVLVAATLPLYAYVADIHLTVRPGWPWMVLSLIAYHGIAEEIAWRGYTFAHLRTDTTFRTAVLRTMPLLALTHIPAVIENGPAVGLAAVAIAAATCIPLAHLYELGGRTIWPAALVHAAIDGFKILDDPGSEPRLTAAISVAAFVIPFLALTWHRGARE